MIKEIKIYKGDIIFCASPDKFTTLENGYIITENNKIKKTVCELPSEYSDCEILDFSGNLIIPGFVDIHLHAPQFENLGLGYDNELLPWLENYTFPEEAKFSDTEYAKIIYSKFIKALYTHGTTRSVVFSSLHLESTEILADLFLESGLGAYVGKVNMDRNSPEFLTENYEKSLEETEYFIKKYNSPDSLVKPIITPRFVPTCTPELMEGLSKLSEKYNIPVQSHLSENLSEIEWVKELHKEIGSYAKVYDHYKMFGDRPTIMAHCIHNTSDEIKLMQEKGVFVAHCPTSNFNLSSGIAPVRKFLDSSVKVGIGTDIAGGHTVSMPETIVAAIHASKMYNVYVDRSFHSLSISEAFFLATKGGGEFFGKVGSFEKDYEFDALIVNDTELNGNSRKNLQDRLEKYIYFGTKEDIKKVFVSGKEINRNRF
ncbi:guanine deaminase [Sebaldella sp. S0638]|uniref:guanine deaminase n=1 Tax=Sebaldella sp. S0638 TaxID=2957809 RepID=UPI0020A0AF06|nr:guanine deaminase [Sebaldella sp. S0638]MCP1223726.1 guanine deaminase [Sebaldella sp. S0638]